MYHVAPHHPGRDKGSRTVRPVSYPHLYYMVKNSWGEAGKYKGLWYASKAFVRYKTMNIIVHKDALPKDIAKKLGIK